jgi:ribonuclease HII
LDLSEDWSGLDDSKQLTAERRDVMYARVLKGARAFAWPWPDRERSIA